MTLFHGEGSPKILQKGQRTEDKVRAGLTVGVCAFGSSYSGISTTRRFSGSEYILICCVCNVYISERLTSHEVS